MSEPTGASADAGARAVVLFDGVCNFCNAAVRFIAHNDPDGRFAFLPLQSPRAQALRSAARSAENAHAAGTDGEDAHTNGAGADGEDARAAGSVADDSDTVVLLTGGRRYERSDAALHIALGLRMPWPLAFALILVPRELRDAAYRWIARNRYALFGKQDVCPLPPPSLRERFLDPEMPEPGGQTPAG